MHGTQSAPPSYYRDLANKNMLDQPDMPRGRYDEQGASLAPIAHQSSSSMMQGASSCREQGTCWSLSGADTPEAEPAPIEKATPSANSSDIPQLLSNVSVERLRGPYAPTLILHGGSGSITRAKLPPALYAQYRASLLEYLASTRQKLNSGTSALDAACHAVSLMEDDPLFNCGRGSVFTEKGTIEMEASVMVSSVQDKGHGGSASSGAEVPTKRGASVSLVQGTRHPVLLAREVLLAGGDGLGGVGTMHCQLSGPDVEEWGWKEKGLERKGPDWFWTRKRWKEHLRDLGKPKTKGQSISPGHGSLSLDGGNREHHQTADLHALSHTGVIEEVDDFDYPSQGTVGTVCMDSWGNLAVATSTGGLTNKKAGRIGDTPTVGAGFWAESWEDDDEDQWGEPPESSRYPIDRQRSTLTQRLARALDAGFGEFWRDCLPKLSQSADVSRKILPCSEPRTEHLPLIEKEQPHPIRQGLLSYPPPNSLRKTHLPRRRAVALGGTGNGDSFLRTAAVRTSAAMCRFGSRPNRRLTLCEAVTRVAGPGGELQRSAGNRWQKTFEGQGGVIGIELVSNEQEGKVVFDFNCGGMWRAWIDEETGEPRVMVFKGEYQA